MNASGSRAEWHLPFGRCSQGFSGVQVTPRSRQEIVSLIFQQSE